MGAAPRFGIGGIYTDAVTSPPQSPIPSPAPSPARSRPASAVNQPIVDRGPSRPPRGRIHELERELTVTKIALRKAKQETISWQERALAAEQAVLELHTHASERSSLNISGQSETGDISNVMDAAAELAELHELIASQAATIEKLAEIAQLPLDDSPEQQQPPQPQQPAPHAPDHADHKMWQPDPHTAALMHHHVIHPADMGEHGHGERVEGARGAVVLQRGRSTPERAAAGGPVGAELPAGGLFFDPPDDELE